jgi:hypothetical protein
MSCLSNLVALESKPLQKGEGFEERGLAVIQ